MVGHSRMFPPDSKVIMQGKALGHVGPCAACTSAVLIARRFELVVEEDTVLEGHKKDAYNVFLTGRNRTGAHPHC